MEEFGRKVEPVWFDKKTLLMYTCFGRITTFQNLDDASKCGTETPEIGEHSHLTGSGSEAQIDHICLEYPAGKSLDFFIRAIGLEMVRYMFVRGLITIFTTIGRTNTFF